jgi:hypothetical protein
MIANHEDHLECVKAQEEEKLGKQIRFWLAASLLITHQGLGVPMDLLTTGAPRTSPFFHER